METIKSQLSRDYEVNSLEWWEKYFGNGLWNYYDGGKQTLFFAKVAWEHVNPVFINAILKERLSICDVGCAEGEGVNFIQNVFPKSEVSGIELSQQAVKNATQKFPACHFICARIEELPNAYDVVFSSNVLEHLKDPKEELQKLFRQTKRYCIIMCPVNDDSGEISHINHFEKNFFYENCPIGGKIAQLEIINTSNLDDSYWGGEQILVVYEKEDANERININQLVAKPETWDSVAETYHIALEDSDIQLANEIEKILLQHGLKAGDSLMEMGCGSGHLSACLAQKGYHVVLVDFSPIALEKAQQTFEKYGLQGKFILGDLFHLDKSIPACDFAWNSGVMEHFGDDELIELTHNIGRYAQKGILCLIPNSNSIAYLLMRARLMADDNWPYGEEYLRRDYEEILKVCGYQFVEKSYITTAEISAYQLWKAEREESNISELYRKLAEESVLPVEEGYLVSYFASNLEQNISLKHYEGTTVQDTRIYDLVTKKIGYAEQQVQIKALKHRIQELENEKKWRVSDEQQVSSKLVESEYENILEQNQKLEKEVQHYRVIYKEQNEYISQAQQLCNHFATGKLMRLNHLLFRIKGQLLKGTKAERKEFFAWMGGRIKRTNRSIGAGEIYNPWMVVRGKLQEAVNCSLGKIDRTNLADIANSSMALPLLTKEILQQNYTKYDVIILSVIDYNFRFQRPQHFAKRFAANGHRVFYINANFIRPDTVKADMENLFVVDFFNNHYNAIYAIEAHTALSWMKEKLDKLLFDYAIRDAVIIVDYPNWVEGAVYMREKYGFKIITDYMDDYTGFLGTAEKFLKDNCIHLLQISDRIVASSQFLYEVAASHTEETKIEIIRNGTEVEHFYQAVCLETPDKKRKTIGYYGAVSHWFAWEKVCYLARKFPECDIVIVGDVTEYRTKLEQYANIKLLGEKPYKELPQYLADFDVCLIPFDTSTDLIKATNPVKFYEYLSAGKKIVATEIPELMPYRDQYVYMSNENEAFAEYVRLCLDGKDCLKKSEECITFARENDWQERYKIFEKSCTRCIPKVSIIVLTYNNLALNKQCIDSILHKTAYGNHELIVVDNASTDGTVEYLNELRRQEIPGVKIILNDQNKGFAGGNNIGMEAATGDYVLLLNNDTVVSRGWLTALTKHLESNEKYAMCNPVTNSIGNESKIKVCYHNIQEMHEFAYMVTASKMNEEYTEVDRMPLFATLIRRKFIDSVGMLDETYKIGMFEDDDYTETAKAAGYGFVIAEDAFIHHINNGAFKQMKDEEYRRIFESNKEQFEAKWHKKWAMPKYRDGVDWDTNQSMGL